MVSEEVVGGSVDETQARVEAVLGVADLNDRLLQHVGTGAEQMLAQLELRAAGTGGPGRGADEVNRPVAQARGPDGARCSVDGVLQEPTRAPVVFRRGENVGIGCRDRCTRRRSGPPA